MFGTYFNVRSSDSFYDFQFSSFKKDYASATPKKINTIKVKFGSNLIKLKNVKESDNFSRRKK